MSKYVIKAGKPLYVEDPLWPDAEAAKISLTVDDAKSVDTGLINEEGFRIYRLQEPIGFHSPNG